MTACVASQCLADSQSREKAGVLGRDVIEYLDSVDYNKYYESLQQPGTRGGDKEKMFADFSLSSIRAASVSLQPSSLVVVGLCGWCANLD